MQSGIRAPFDPGHKLAGVRLGTRWRVDPRDREAFLDKERLPAVIWARAWPSTMRGRERRLDVRDL
jgi:hypothetical protein